MSYQAGDTVLYGTQGVFKIDEIGERTYDKAPVLYYILKPVCDDRSLTYIPVHNETATARLRHILSVSEVHELIKTMSDADTIWVENESERRMQYKEILARADRHELIKLIKTIYLYGIEQTNNGKKLHMSDERIMKSAEKILYDEFAHVLDIPHEQVSAFIADYLESNQQVQPSLS